MTTPKLSQWLCTIKMIKIRNKIAQDEDVLKSIMAAVTVELRFVYRPKNTAAPSEIKKPIGIVAIIKEKVVGLAEYLICEDNVLIRGLAVSPGHRGQGVARAIIEHVAHVAQKKSKTELLLNTIKETGNTNIFSRMGFTVDSEEISDTFEDVHGKQVTLVSMSKKLNSESL